MEKAARLFITLAMVAGHSNALIQAKADSRNFQAVAMLALLWCERPGPREISEILGCSRMTMPPIGKIGLTSFSLLQMVGETCYPR